VLLLLLSLYCIDLFSCKAASVFIINLLTYYHIEEKNKSTTIVVEFENLKFTKVNNKTWAIIKFN